MSETEQCLYCGDTERSDTERLAVEHLIPRTRGGLDIPENIFRACRSCNASKSNRLPSEWRDDLPAGIYDLERRALMLHPEVVPRNKRDEKQIQTAIRLPESFVNRLDRFALNMSEPGKRFTRSEVLRLAAFRGLEQLELEGPLLRYVDAGGK